jgi:pre-mRNA-splicing factor ATP-dependent RNA helicase DHX15/PRP43
VYRTVGNVVCEAPNLSVENCYNDVAQILKQRPELKLVVMGSTLEAEKFRRYFYNAPLMKVPGCLHPVEIVSTPVSVNEVAND